MGKADQNKKAKFERLLNTSFELFTSKGLNKTSISDIVEKAGVAKGTLTLLFYHTGCLPPTDSVKVFCRCPRGQFLKESPSISH